MKNIHGLYENKDKSNFSDGLVNANTAGSSPDAEALINMIFLTRKLSLLIFRHIFTFNIAVSLLNGAVLPGLVDDLVVTAAA